MHLDMIKPFKIISTRQEPDGGTGVTFEVSKTIYLSEAKTETKSLKTYISVPAGEDIDMYLFKDLQQSGWL
jgi:hypothetical protein